MKTWSRDHPKARMMARKRADILAASKQAFLGSGYEGTSMESIAKAANVSIMTLYRHARTKDDLFCAVISNACDPGDEAERAEMEAILSKPFEEALVITALKAQSRLTDPGTIALIRTVIAGASRFPDLAQMAYTGLVGGLVGMVEFVLGCKVEAGRLDEQRRHALATRFVDMLVGADMLGVLMGFPAPTSDVLLERSGAAANQLVMTLAKNPRIPDP